MIDFKTARRIVLGVATPRGQEDVTLIEASGRVLAKDVRARIDSPLFDRSRMDGFAVRAADARGGRVLVCRGKIHAGEMIRARVRRGDCVAIATGAMISPGADSVVMKEDVVFVDSQHVRVTAAVKKGQHIARKAEDVRRGDLLLKRGVVLGPSRVALLASAGVSRVTVWKRPSVCVLTTGNEIREPGQVLSSGQIYNASAAMVLGALRSLFLRPVYLGICRDEPARLRKKIARARGADILILTGGVSVGDRDYIPEILRKLGAKILFHRVKIKPGKPFLLARWGRTVVFGLPGNPVSSYVNFFLFVRPAIQSMMGVMPLLKLQAGVLRKPAGGDRDGRMSFLPARCMHMAGRIYLDPLAYSGSGDVRAISKAHALIVLAADRPIAKTGETVEFLEIRDGL